MLVRSNFPGGADGFPEYGALRDGQGNLSASCSCEVMVSQQQINDAIGKDDDDGDDDPVQKPSRARGWLHSNIAM